VENRRRDFHLLPGGVVMHAPHDKARTATDAAAALDFIKSQFEHTEGPVNVCVLKNDSKGAGATITSRDPAVIDAFIRKQDKPGQSVYFCVSTLSAEGEIHAKGNAVELAFAHADTDMKDIINETPESALAKIRALKYPPSRIVWSGHGWHSYWFYSEPLVLPTDDTRQAVIEEYDNFLGVLCDFVGGDTKPAHVAGLMRVVGTHNTKNGDWIKVDVAEDNGRRYELSDLQEWQAESSPKFLRKGRERDQTAGQRGNVWEEFAKNFKTPIDVEKRLAGMMFMGTGDAAIHDTQISVIASMLNAGVPVDEVVKVVKAATVVAAGDYGARWNWAREEKAIRKACDTWLVKHPPKAAPKSSGAKTASAGLGHNSGKAMHNHVTLAKFFLDNMAQSDRQFCKIPDAEQRMSWWKFQDDLWMLQSEADFKASAAEELQDILIKSDLEKESDNKLISESLGFINRSKLLKRSEPVRWDDHGKVATKSELIDPVTLQIEPLRKEHFATHRLEVVFDEAATCPHWQQMLVDMFCDQTDTDRTTTIELIQELIGLAMIDYKIKSLRALTVFLGEGDTGKSELLGVIGGFLSANPITTPLAQLDANHGTQSFVRGSCVWILPEAFSTSHWHYSETLKEIIGGEPIEVNPKNHAAITIIPRVSAFFGSNHAPQFKDSSTTMAARTKIIPTTHVFDKNNPVGVAAEARRQNLTWKPQDLVLNTERSGLLNWALVGLKRALERGRLINTKAGEAILEEVKEDANLVTGFIKDCISFDTTLMMSTPDFNAAYAGWWHENHGDERGKFCPSPKSVGKHLKALAHPLIAINKHRFKNEDGMRFYVGIKFNSAGVNFWGATVGGGLDETQYGRLGIMLCSRTSHTLKEMTKPVLESWKDAPEIVRITANARAMRKKASEGTAFPITDDE
jgi:P4 family phage/plasmid primase-like protien